MSAEMDAVSQLRRRVAVRGQLWKLKECPYTKDTGCDNTLLISYCVPDMQAGLRLK